jgi:hypothetical protein
MKGTEMRAPRWTRIGVAAVAAAGVVLGGSAAAWARTNTTDSTSAAADTTSGGAAMTGSLQTIKDRADAAITARLDKLHTVITSVQASPTPDADKTALVDRMQADITGLTSLDATIKADTTASAARTDAKKIFTDFRIYALVVPSTRMVVAADAVQDVAAPRLTTVADRLQARITKKNATAEQPVLDDMKAKIADATTATEGMSQRHLALTPADWNANHGVLDSDLAKLKTARTDLRAARQDGKTIVAALRAK